MSTTQRKATIDDVAELAGVSIKTVSRVFNREPNVRESTRRKVEQAIARLRYQPNPSARNLASQRARLIGLIYDDPSQYEIPSAGYVIFLQQGALRACRAANYELLIHPCNYRDRHVGDELKAVIEQVRPAGLVIAAPLSNMKRIVEPVMATETPCVRLSPGRPQSGHFDVGTNDREVSAKMTAYLASEGHRRIAFIRGHPNHRAVAQRFEGYRDALKAANLPYSEDLVCAGDNSFGAGVECAEALLARTPRPTAIFAANDDMAAGVIRVADRLGIAIPSELSVAGCDDIALAQQVYPALTTIRQPLGAMAERAVEALIASGHGRPVAAGSETIEADLVIRDSTGPAPD